MRSFPPARTRLAVAAVVAALATALAACNTDPYATETAAEPPAGTDGELLVIGPADGDTVTAPFEVAVTAGVDLGPAEDGLHHIEIWFGDQREETLTRHFAATTTVEEAPEGETKMWVQLATAEQEPVGAPITLALTVKPAGDQADQEGGEEGGENSDQEEPTPEQTDEETDEPTDEPTGDGDGY